MALGENRLEIFTDGACWPNPGNGGWAYVIPSLGVEKSGGAENTTNNRMEMQAIIEAIKATTGPIIIHTDSQLCVGLTMQKWKAKKNVDQVQEVRRFMGLRSVKVVWVRGHNGHVHNERCDVLAGGEVAKLTRLGKVATEKALDAVDWRLI